VCVCVCVCVWFKVHNVTIYRIGLWHSWGSI
jgi:hypothetical protein